ncbi:MAG: tol-pal system YbgF family protein [Gemmatimonadales bacterium]
MSTTRQFLIGASVAAATFIAAPANAQSGAARLAGSLSPHVASTNPSPAFLADARRLMEEGKFKEARRTYRAIVDEQRAAGEYPVDALRGVVQAEFALKNDRATAIALDELAEAASLFGDPETRIRSLFQAALVYQQLNMRTHVVDRLGEIRALLKSPAISAETRKDIFDRIPKE